MKKNSFQSAMQRSAEARYSNYNGDLGQAPGMMNVLNRTLTVKVVNASNTSGTFVVFGYSEYGDGASAGSDAFVTVTIAESSHAQVKRDSAGSPFYIAGMKYLTTDVAQFSNNLTVAMKSTTGKQVSYQVQPQNWNNPNNQNTLLLLATPDDFSLTINSYTYITGTIEAGCTITLTMTLAGRTDISQTFSGNSPVSVSNSPYPTGQAPVVLQQSTGNNAVSNVMPMISKSS